MTVEDRQSELDRKLLEVERRYCAELFRTSLLFLGERRSERVARERRIEQVAYEQRRRRAAAWWRWSSLAVLPASFVPALVLLVKG